MAAPQLVSLNLAAGIALSHLGHRSSLTSASQSVEMGESSPGSSAMTGTKQIVMVAATNAQWRLDGRALEVHPLKRTSAMKLVEMASISGLINAMMETWSMATAAQVYA